MKLHCTSWIAIVCGMHKPECHIDNMRMNKTGYSGHVLWNEILFSSDFDMCNIQEVDSFIALFTFSVIWQ